MFLFIRCMQWSICTACTLFSGL